MTKILITYTEVKTCLMEVGGLRKREAEALLKRRMPEPVAHGLHSRLRWHREKVLDFARRIRQDGVSLGKDAPDAVSKP